MTVALAIYAAVVATGGFLWQLYQWFHARRPHIFVGTSMSFMHVGPDLIDVVAIAVVNRSAYQVRVTSLGIDLQDGSGRTLQPYRTEPGSTLPGVVAPQDSGTAYMLRSDVEARGVIDVHEPLTAFANLSTGETHRSKPKILVAR